MRMSPWMRAATLVLLAAVTSTTVYSQKTKAKKSGDSGSTTSADQSSSGDDTSGGATDTTGSKDASKTDDKSKGDTSKTGFDDGTYAEATAITYKAMQSIAKEIADKKGSATTYVVFDPTTFANIAQYRITFPQVVLTRTSFCDALTAYDNATTKPADSTGFVPKDTAGASQGGGGLAGLTPAGQIVDLAQKVLTMLQTTTTIAGASVNVTDEALVAEVATRLAGTGVAVYYPAEFLLPELGDSEIGPAIKDGCTGAPDFDHSHHIVPEIVRVGVARAKAAQRYQMLSAALDKYNAVVNPPAKKAETDPQAQNNEASPPTNPKTPKKAKKPEPAARGVATPAPPPAADPAKMPQPTAQQKAAALKEFTAETGFIDTANATGFQTNLKAYMDTYDALLTSLAVTDPKGQSLFSKLVIAERLNSILKPPTTADPSDQAKAASLVNVVIVKWLRAGALNKTRKNLFFLGQRNYYAGGATGLYEYFDGDQKMLASGTITKTSPYVHDKDFDNNGKNRKIDLINLHP